MPHEHLILKENNILKEFYIEIQKEKKQAPGTWS
jgi:hypothetical protein